MISIEVKSSSDEINIMGIYQSFDDHKKAEMRKAINKFIKKIPTQFYNHRIRLSGILGNGTNVKRIWHMPKRHRHNKINDRRKCHKT